MKRRNPYEYTSYTKPDLQRMLSGRDLAITGNKGELVARLTEYDSHHPFPFLKLPGEIQNEIYRYVAIASNDGRKPRATVPATYFENQASNIDMGNKRNSASITAPGLFYTCSQVYHESRVFFYRHHDFRLYIWQDYKGLRDQKTLAGFRRHSKCMKRMISWLDAVGPDMRKEIRNLDIELQCYESVDVTAYSCFIDDLHGRLSDDATVTYRPVAASPMNGLEVLYKLGRVFYGRDPGQVPRFEYPAWANPLRAPPGDEDNIWYYLNPYFLGSPPRRRNVEVLSLTFEPGAGWFGGKSEGIDV